MGHADPCNRVPRSTVIVVLRMPIFPRLARRRSFRKFKVELEDGRRCEGNLYAVFLLRFMHSFAQNMKYAVLQDSKGDMPEEDGLTFSQLVFKQVRMYQSRSQIQQGKGN